MTLTIPAMAIPGLAAADMLTSLMALNGILMALLRRRETGNGDYVDVAMMDTLLACMPNNVGPVFAEGRAPVPTHERSWGGHSEEILTGVGYAEPEIAAMKDRGVI